MQLVFQVGLGFAGMGARNLGNQRLAAIADLLLRLLGAATSVTMSGNQGIFPVRMNRTFGFIDR